MLEDYYIGDVATDDTTDAADEAAAVEDDQNVEVALNPRKWIDFKLVNKEILTHDTRRFQFALHTPTTKLGLPVGHHFLIQARINGQLVIRAYTPTSSDDDVGIMELVVKIYFKNVHPKFPEGGKLTQYLETLSIGDALTVRGPLGHYEYVGKGQINVHGKLMQKKQLGFLCGGTGITPAYQIIKAVCKDPEDTTEVSLLFANQSPDDILLRTELDELAAMHPKFKVWYTVDRPTDDWKYSVGFISEEMIRDHLPAPTEDSFIGMCGPPPMIKFACLPNLEKIGFTSDQHVCF
eukprot:Plantae.Rhodophyta-Rhodochaete_pulchella.ctg5319.p1 GENE.Plantae.Rhodophyta-Rhodochaete_pulchella.ctg5319~~Plantae.Rhodophyta-Rhodochaete_pulchella.ctg5319.p1  ORF type:complete len:336 (-),score=72.04 Plantae.Rhodophyta-Rhodochaete_pulchella.ctg5319:154-1032(-)